jgi:hypothetical protein
MTLGGVFGSCVIGPHDHVRNVAASVGNAVPVDILNQMLNLLNGD